MSDVRLQRLIAIVRREAKYLARRLPVSVDMADLIGAGFLGLADALTKRDPNHDGFGAYARVRIRGEMGEMLRRLDPMSRGARKLHRSRQEAVRSLVAELGRAPTSMEVDDRIGGLLARRIEQHPPISITSLDAATNESDAAPSADDQMLCRERVVEVRRALERLPARLRRVLEMYYDEELPLREIGASLGLTEGRACQLRQEALDQLRAILIPSEVSHAA